MGGGWVFTLGPSGCSPWGEIPGQERKITAEKGEFVQHLATGCVFRVKEEKGRANGWSPAQVKLQVPVPVLSSKAMSFSPSQTWEEDYGTLISITELKKPALFLTNEFTMYASTDERRGCYWSNGGEKLLSIGSGHFTAHSMVSFKTWPFGGVLQRRHMGQVTNPRRNASLVTFQHFPYGSCPIFQRNMRKYLRKVVRYWYLHGRYSGLGKTQKSWSLGFEWDMIKRNGEIAQKWPPSPPTWGFRYLRRGGKSVVQNNFTYALLPNRGLNGRNLSWLGLRFDCFSYWCTSAKLNTL